MKTKRFNNTSDLSLKCQAILSLDTKHCATIEKIGLIKVKHQLTGTRRKFLIGHKFSTQYKQKLYLKSKYLFATVITNHTSTTTKAEVFVAMYLSIHIYLLRGSSMEWYKEENP